ncbi:hypothetical protein HN748_01235 [Candidatus Peregrinibacteria bacterium]|jgi:hypothetical protein|nr:hypothetical protein [Candidatus Peregrinibacteria bacterium]MBT7702834.1 hypothetical protein [Candidatus Peregrinibacteria bacterium]
MKSNHSQVILQDPDARNALKSMIAEKSKRYENLEVERGQFLYFNHFESRDEFGQWFLLEIFDELLGGPEMRRIERDLKSMCFQLRRSEGEIPSRTKWDDQYEYATQHAQITDVVHCYLGVSDIHRNLPCPFHKDDKPSFKIYPKTNRFVCFGCNSRGSPIDFVMKYENCSFGEAVLKLNNL